MQLKQLTLTHVRAFEQAKFDFQPGMNLLVGINGAGKSVVLDMLRIMLSQTLPKFTASKSRPLNINQLSDGERGILALVFDLARRLAQANPKLDNPLRDGKAVVLIDALELHLHPYWQRTIVQKLTTTFPNCQFIATTHSPQIIGEVSPDNISFLIDGGKTYLPHQSLGMDSNWILRHLMDADERNVEIKLELRAIEALIENECYDEATAAIDALRTRLGEFAALVELQTHIDMIQFFDEDD